MSLIIFALLLFKHFICDYLTQTPYQITHKQIYGHPGGLLHALIHGMGTFLVLIFFYSPALALVCASLDCLIHYHIDWIKAVITHKFKLVDQGATARKFWALYGFDQFLHQMTYLGIILFAQSIY
ncbi:MAG TPA: DUF3307 domain-containing protein [Gammaproteobacteria bacterium]|nr:DUF3307 domain-containing protein [Gammaproteobacteria bacterium]